MDESVDRVEEAVDRVDEAAVLERLRRIEALEQAHATRAAVLDELRALVREAEACAPPGRDVRGEEAAM